MTLKEMYSQPLATLLEKMEMIDLKVHSDQDGNICSIEVKYEPADRRKEK